MKKIIPFFLLAFCFEISFAQLKDNNQQRRRKTERNKSIKRHLSAKHDSRYLAYPEQTKLYKAGKQKLENEWTRNFDSTVKVVNNDKTEFTYDANGWLSEEKYKTWDEGANQTEVIKIEYTRDGAGRPTTILTWVWDNVKKTWIKESKEELSHNNDSIAARLAITYDVFDNSKEIPLSKIDYGYDINHNLITDTYYEYDTTKKVYNLIDQFVYTYDSKGNKLTDSYSTWNTTTKKYDPVDQYKNTYNSSNNNDTSTYLTYNALTRKWVNSSRDVFTYDAGSNLLTDNYSEWNATGSKWEDVTRTQNTYDSKNNRILSADQDYNIKRGKWTNAYQVQYSYDTSVSKSQLILPYDEETVNLFFKTKHIKTYEYDWNATTSKWDTVAITSYNYKLESGSITLPRTNFEVSVYPNPSHEKISILIKNNTEGLGIKIYDISGKLIQSEELSGNGIININGLTQGIYILQLNKGLTLVGKRKIVVE